MEEHTQDWLQSGRVLIIATLPWQGANSLEASPGGDALSMFGPAPTPQWPHFKVVGQPDGSMVLEGFQDRILLDDQGQWVHRTELGSFAMDEWVWSPEGCWIGLKKGEKPWIQAVDHTGNSLWKLDYLPYKVAQLSVVDGKCMGFFLQNGSTYQTEISAQGCGGAKRVGEGETLPILVSHLQQYYVLSWDAASGQKYWSNLHSETAPQAIPQSLGQAFTFPAGTDQQGNAYGYFGNQMGKVDWATGVTYRMNWEGICLEGTHIFASRMGSDRGGLDLLEVLPDATYRDKWIALPTDWSAELRGRIWKVCRVAEGEFTFLSRSTTNYAWQTVVYNGTSGSWGQVETVSDLASHCQLLGPAQNWGILPDGAIILPLATPEGLVLLRLR